MNPGSIVVDRRAIGGANGGMGNVPLDRLMKSLSRPAAYPLAADAVDVRQTHISVVFLAGDFVYKIKKPVSPGFLDFSTLELRKHFCEEEVRLNARLAADVYLGVVPVVEHDGELCFEGDGEAVEWAVKMKRLPDDATLEFHLAHGKISPELIDAVARRIADFHAHAEANERIASFGRFDVVAANARQNFEQAREHTGRSISAAVYDRLQRRTEEALSALRETITSRVVRGVPRDTHGDLRLDHVYALGQRPEPRLVIVDCIEFNEQYRYADPVSDIAFLAMDFKFAGAPAAARRLTETYFAAVGDEEGRRLLPFYTSYRAAVRGKVEGIKSLEAEVQPLDRERALRRARGYWLLALAELEPYERRPALVLVSGLPGSGKSTLAAGLAEAEGFELIRSDVVRKELTGRTQEASQPRPFGTDIYTAEWNERTYTECLRRVTEHLFEGKRVLVDASFREDAMRRTFIAAAKDWAVPILVIECRADAEIIRQRLAARRGDASDADWSTHLAAAERWEPASEVTRSKLHVIDSGGSREASLSAARALLHASIE